MSAFTPEAARVERATTLTTFTEVELLEAVGGLGIHDGYPVSGDMLATIKRGTRTTLYRRRIAANHPEGEPS